MLHAVAAEAVQEARRARKRARAAAPAPAPAATGTARGSDLGAQWQPAAKGAAWSDAER
jgi:hypothetical protein